MCCPILVNICKHFYSHSSNFQKNSKRSKMDSKRSKMDSKLLPFKHTKKTEIIENGIFCCDKLKKDISTYYMPNYPISENVLKFSTIYLKTLFLNLQNEFG